MKKSFICLFFTFFTVLNSLSQGIQDSTFEIKTFEINADRIFKKEAAGMKETIIDTLVLLERINVNLSDLLTQNSTIYIKSYGRGALATASFRGTAPTHTKVTWNGMPINSPMLGMVDFSTIPVYILDNVDIQYGGASVSQNGGALGGNINLGNHVNWTNTFSGRVLTGYGSFSTYDAMAQVNIGNKKTQSKTRAYLSQSENDYEFVNKHIIGFPTQKNTDAAYGKKGILQEIYYRPFDKWTTSAKIWYQNGDRSIPLVMSYEGSDSISRNNHQDDITLKSTADINYFGNNHNVKFRTGYDYQQLDYVMTIGVSGLGDQKPVDSRSKMHSSYNHIEDEYTALDNLSFKLSADLNYFNITSIDSANLTGYDEKRFEYSVFAGGYYQAFDFLNLSTELRKDGVPNTTTPLIYNLGFSIKPLSNYNIVWNNSYSRNFHNPSLNDLYWVPGGNPDLLPEEGYTIETNLHGYFDFIKHNIEIQLTSYYSDIDNWILWLPSTKGYWEAMNLKRVVSYGLEFNLKYAYRIGEHTFKIQSNYAYTSTTNQGEAIGDIDKSVGKQLPFIPLHSFNSLLSWQYHHTFINYQYQYYGVRNLLSSNLATLEDDSGSEEDVPFYQLYAIPLQHISLGQYFYFKHNKNSLKVELKVNNLFNESYRNVLNRFMPGRYGELLVTYHF